MVQSSDTSSVDTGPAEAAPEPDAAPPPSPPAGRPRVNFRKWWARFIVLLLLAAAVLVFIRISSDRSSESNRVNLEDVTLTAQAIPVEPAQAGQVTEVLVTAQQRVTTGQRVGRIEVTGTTRAGNPKITKVYLTAPRSGIVIDLPAPIGATVGPSLPFLQMYDPAQMTFFTEVKLEDLPVIAPTMVATLKSEGMKRTVRATVQRIVPRVQGATTTSGDHDDALQVVLTPASGGDAQGLVPGMHFTGYINTVTGQPGTTRLVSLPQLTRR